MMVSMPGIYPFTISRSGNLYDDTENWRLPHIRLDSVFKGGWSLLYGSKKHNVIFKLARAEKRKERGVAEQMLEDEMRIYAELSRTCKLFTPRFYGTYDWNGHRALALSYEGTSLASLNIDFASLSLLQRSVSDDLQLRKKLTSQIAESFSSSNFSSSTGRASSTTTLNREMCCRSPGGDLLSSILHSLRQTIPVLVGGRVTSSKKPHVLCISRTSLISL